jgi:hypothetical protein
VALLEPLDILGRRLHSDPSDTVGTAMISLFSLADDMLMLKLRGTDSACGAADLLWDKHGLQRRRRPYDDMTCTNKMPSPPPHLCFWWYSPGTEGFPRWDSAAPDGAIGAFRPARSGTKWLGRWIVVVSACSLTGRGVWSLKIVQPRQGDRAHRRRNRP